MEKEEIEKRLSKLGGWLHAIDLGHGIVTSPTLLRENKNAVSMWEQTRTVRKDIDYKNKLVLDLGCAEGLWAFEAEKLGAREVVGVDLGGREVLERALFAKEVLGSSVIFYFGVPVEDLAARLDCFFNYQSNGEKFDIIQHLGLLYHLRDPLLSLSQTRRCIKTGGTLLLETAIYLTDLKEPICLFNWRARIYSDGSTWWAPNLLCLLAMLRLSLFEPDESSIKICQQDNPRAIGRINLIAKAVGEETVSNQVAYELRQAWNIGKLEDTKYKKE